MRKMEDIPDHVVVLGMKVQGTVGERTEEVCCLDMNVAFAQNDAFKRAGYHGVMLVPTYFVFDKERNCYPIKMGEPVGLIERVIAPRYSRADINPGINVYRYDRDVLKRRMTGIEMMLAACTGMVVLGAMSCVSAVVMWKMISPFAGFIGLLIPITIFWASIIRYRDSGFAGRLVRLGYWITGNTSP